MSHAPSATLDQDGQAKIRNELVNFIYLFIYSVLWFRLKLYLALLEQEICSDVLSTLYVEKKKSPLPLSGYVVDTYLNANTNILITLSNKDPPKCREGKWLNDHNQ